MILSSRPGSYVQQLNIGRYRNIETRDWYREDQPRRLSAQQHRPLTTQRVARYGVCFYWNTPYPSAELVEAIAEITV